MVRRVGVIGDVHCESATLGRALDALESTDLDAILCVGDLIDGAGDADATLDMLRTHGVQCVAGNHERWFLTGQHRGLDNATVQVTRRSRVFLESLPKLRRYATSKGGVLLSHGVGEDDEAWLRPDTRGYALQDIPTLRELMLDESIQFLIGGHTHERMVRTFSGLTVINAGTLHRNNEQTFTVVDFEAMRVTFHSATEGKTGELIEELELPIPEPSD